LGALPPTILSESQKLFLKKVLTFFRESVKPFVSFNENLPEHISLDLAENVGRESDTS